MTHTMNTAITVDTDNTPGPLASAAELLANIRKARDAYRAHNATIPPLEAAHQASAAARANADASRVLALADGDMQAAKDAASKAKAHAATQAKELAALDDAQRIAAALRGRVEALESQLQALHPDLDAAVLDHQQRVLQDLQTELERAVQPLVAWAHRASRVGLAAGVRIERQLHDLLIRNLIDYTPMVSYGYANGVVIGTVDDGVQLPEGLAEPLQLLQAVKGYRNLATSEAAVAFELVGPNTGLLTRRAIEARNAAKAAELGLSLGTTASLAVP